MGAGRRPLATASGGFGDQLVAVATESVGSLIARRNWKAKPSLPRPTMDFTQDTATRGDSIMPAARGRSREFV